jgi:RNA recognition motif-containing protein
MVNNCRYFNIDFYGRSRCVGFVRMSQHVQAIAAINALNGTTYLGKILSIKLGIIFFLIFF